MTQRTPGPCPVPAASLSTRPATLPALSLTTRPAMLPLTGAPLAAFHGGARLSAPNDALDWLAPPLPTAASAGLSTRPRIAPLPVPRVAPRIASRRGPRIVPGIVPRPRLAAFHLSPSSLAWAVAALSPMAVGSTFAAEPPAPPAPPPEPHAVVTPMDHLGYDGVRIWESVRGQTVIVTLVDGLAVRGVLLTEGAGEIALAREPDGLVMRIPKELVLGLRLPPAPLPTPPRALDPEERRAAEVEAKHGKRPRSGAGLIAAGATLTGVGSLLTLGFVVASAADSSFGYYGAPILLLGSTFFGPGIPLLAVGIDQQGKRRAWDRAELEISTTPIRGGWSGQLSLRF